MKEIDTFGYNLITSHEKVLFDIFKALDKRITALEGDGDAGQEIGEVEDVHNQSDGWGHVSFTLRRKAHQAFPTKDNPCPTCDGEDILINVSGDRFKPPTIPCPDCGGKHFIPGKGRGM